MLAWWQDLGSVQKVSCISLSGWRFGCLLGRERGAFLVAQTAHVQIFLRPQAVPANMAQPGCHQHEGTFPSEKAPTTGVMRLISRRILSNGLLVRIQRQCSYGKS